ncbi:MAG: HD-GYP domain-containing protein [Candidatus Aquicultor sp.]|nr:HD-GYP domain-containing protein [Candidatus Aquicultor sp.]
MLDVLTHLITIILVLTGVGYISYYYRRISNEIRPILIAILFGYALTNIFELFLFYTEQPIYHLLISYPNSVMPMLLIGGLLLSIQSSEREQLEIEQQRLMVLHNIGNRANNSLDIKEIARNTLSELLEATSFSGIALYLSPRNKDYLELTWSEGLFKELDIDLSIIDAKKVYFTFSMLNSEIIEMNDSEYCRELPLCNKLKQVGITNVLAAELSSNQNSIGILLFIANNDIAISDEQKRFIGGACHWLSTAISNAKSIDDLRTAYFKITLSFSKAIETKDPYTRGHSDSVAVLSCEFSSYLGLNKQQIEKVYVGGRLHDIGKIGIPKSILNKPESLTEEEYAVIKEHVHKGLEIVQPINRYMNVADIVVYHHERYDGSGYPIGLSGENIPFLARIVSIADAFDAMTSNRAYRQAMSTEQALENIKKNKGSQFDPLLADHFISMIEKKKVHEHGVGITADELAALIGETFLNVEEAAG